MIGTCSECGAATRLQEDGSWLDSTGFEDASHPHPHDHDGGAR